MKPIPRHWASLRETRTLAAGKAFDLTVHGCSDLSVEDARRDARERLEHLVASGGPASRHGGDREYYPDRRLPEELLEEIHSPDGTLIAAITRNRYGAAVLNTDALLISDIDLPGDATARPRRRGKRPGLLSRLFGGTGTGTGTGTGAGAGALAGAGTVAADADGSGRGPDGPEAPGERGLEGSGPRGEAHAHLLQVIEDFGARHPELGVRTYRTRNGFRLLVTGSGAGPRSDRAQELMAQVSSDALYMILCRVHDTYRARLTPKPWRIEVDRFESLGTRTAADEEHRAWVERYRAASQGVAVCRLLGTSGPTPGPAEQQIIELHDRAVRPESGLRLA